VAVFLSTYLNKVDRKGRVSVPAAFRAALAGSGSSGIVAYRAVKLPAIEAAGLDRIEEMSRRLDSLPELSEEREALATLLADMEQLAFDGEGRIMLPPGLAKHAGIEGDATFVGGGPTFQIWEAGRFKRHQEEMRARIRERGLTLPPMAPK
jgi:MraZ protein